MRSLDTQVQEIKSDVLAIGSELAMLEERLLFPSNTQVSVFVALSSADPMRLDAVQLMINGEVVADYIYSFKELEALQKGGVQRLYTGNLARGEHTLSVSMIAKSPNGSEVSESSDFTFTKGVEPELLGLTLANPGLVGPAIEMTGW